MCFFFTIYIVHNPLSKAKQSKKRDFRSISEHRNCQER